MAWLLIGVGAIVVGIAAWRARRRRQQREPTPLSPTWLIENCYRDDES